MNMSHDGKCMHSPSVMEVLVMRSIFCFLKFSSYCWREEPKQSEVASLGSKHHQLFVLNVDFRYWHSGDINVSFSQLLMQCSSRFQAGEQTSAVRRAHSSLSPHSCTFVLSNIRTLIAMLLVVRSLRKNKSYRLKTTGYGKWPMILFQFEWWRYFHNRPLFGLFQGRITRNDCSCFP